MKRSIVSIFWCIKIPLLLIAVLLWLEDYDSDQRVKECQAAHPGCQVWICQGILHNVIGNLYWNQGGQIARVLKLKYMPRLF